MYTINYNQYSKTIWPMSRGGYNPRPKGVKPQGIDIHTTNGVRGSTFDAEARFLRDNNTPGKKVGAGYLVGKKGEIAQIVPDEFAAWQAGAVASQYEGIFDNDHSIGIECHYTDGEVFTQEMHDALTWLVRKKMAEYGIIKEHIETHRKIAIPGPNIRKHDPSGWDDVAFYAWRATLDQPDSNTGQIQVDPAFVTAWNISGGIWRLNMLTPGYPLTLTFSYNNLLHQQFERAIARRQSDGTIAWLLLSEMKPFMG